MPRAHRVRYEPFLRGCSVILIFIFSQDSYVPNVPYVV